MLNLFAGLDVGAMRRRKDSADASSLFLPAYGPCFIFDTQLAAERLAVSSEWQACVDALADPSLAPPLSPGACVRDLECFHVPCFLLCCWLIMWAVYAGYLVVATVHTNTLITCRDLNLRIALSSVCMVVLLFAACSDSC